MAVLELGSALRSARLAHGLTQVALAKRAGVTQTYISQLERGARANPAAAVGARLAAALEVSPDALGPNHRLKEVRQVSSAALPRGSTKAP
jgi:transcriptional regulator with XRE-family HTH domain